MHRQSQIAWPDPSREESRSAHQRQYQQVARCIAAMDVRSLEGTSEGNKHGVSGVVNTMRQIRYEDAHANKSPKKSAIREGDNSSVPFVLPSEEEDALIQRLRQAAQRAGDEDVANADEFWLRACLRVRKGDEERARALAGNYLQWRRDVRYEESMRGGLTPILQEILTSGLFCVAGNKSRGDRPVLTVRYRFFNPRKFSALDVAHALGVVVEFLLREYPTSQSHGIVVVDDTAHFTFANFDLRVIRFLEKAFSQVLPVRIAAIYVVNPGWVVKTVFNLVSGFMSRKIKARITICSSGDVAKFAQYFEPHNIQTFLNLGGTLEWSDVDQKQFADRIAQICTQWPSPSSLPTAK